MRLKLAGVIYIDPAATALMPEPSEASDEQPVLSLWEVAPPEASLTTEIRRVSRKKGMKVETLLTDSLSVTVTAPEEEE